MVYLFLILGFVVLIKGADFFVEGASNIAKSLKLPPVLIGLTVVAFGTSSPEAAVSISAALKESGSIALGNILGSNIFNIFLIIGITTIIAPLKVERLTIKKEIPLALLSSIVLLIIMADIKLQNLNDNLITRADGLILLCFFAIFIYYIIEIAIFSRESAKSEVKISNEKSIITSMFYTIIGLFAIIFGGDMVVKNSIKIALALGMSETLVGLTIVSIGTSLPELITSITAAIKKESEIALGNIIGSNIFNILFVLGISSAISPVFVDSKMFLDAFILIGATFLLLILASTDKKISKAEGLFLTLLYVMYMAYIIIRN